MAQETVLAQSLRLSVKALAQYISVLLLIGLIQRIIQKIVAVSFPAIGLV